MTHDAEPGAQASWTREQAVIDVHAHHVPPALADLVDTEGPRYGLGTERTADRVAFRLGDHTTRPLHPRLWDLTSRVDRMDRAGVDVQVLSTWTELAGYHLDEDAAVFLARGSNDALAAAIGSVPDRFLGLAAIPLQHPDAAARELRRAVVELGFVGAQVAASLPGLDLGDTSLDPLWRMAEELSCLILVHPIGGLRGCGVAGEIDSLVGRPAETTVVVTQAIASGLFSRHPGLEVCVVHGGGFLPYHRGRIEGREALPGAAIVGFDAVAQRLFYDTVLREPTAIRLLLDQVGSGRVLLGTDDPFEGGDQTPLRTLDGVPRLDDIDRRHIVGENAQRLFAGIRRAR